jgi:hypothetical protein
MSPAAISPVMARFLEIEGAGFPSAIFGAYAVSYALMACRRNWFVSIDDKRPGPSQTAPSYVRAYPKHRVVIAQPRSASGVGMGRAIDRLTRLLRPRFRRTDPTIIRELDFSFRIAFPWKRVFALQKY